MSWCVGYVLYALGGHFLPNKFSAPETFDRQDSRVIIINACMRHPLRLKLSYEIKRAVTEVQLSLPLALGFGIPVRAVVYGLVKQTIFETGASQNPKAAFH